MNDDDTPRVDDAADEGDGSSQTSEPAEPAGKKIRTNRRARAGRPRGQFSSQVAELLVDVVAKGCHLDIALKAVGASAAMLTKWRRQHREFDSQLSRAESQCEAKLVAVLNGAAQDDWWAALALLKARWPERWSERRGDRVASEAAKMFAVNINFVTSEIIEQEKRRIAAQRQYDEATGSAGSIETSSRPVIEESQEEPPPGEPRN